MDTAPETPPVVAEEETKNDSTAVRLGVLLGILVLSLVVFSTEFFIEDKKIAAHEPETLKETINPFEHLTLEAKGAYVYDITTGEALFAKNDTAQLPLASLTKIMTAFVASELVPDSRSVVLSEAAIAVEGDNGLRAGERWRFKDLLDYTLVVSSNDGAYAIAGAAGASIAAASDPHISFVGRMNQKAVELGLPQTFFINESGLDTNEAVGGGYGSARDMAVLLSSVVMEKPHLLEATTYEVFNIASQEFLHDATNTNTALGSIPNIIASKTGFTDLAGGNLAVAFDAGVNRPVVAVVLGSSYDGRFTDMEKLVRATLKRIGQ